MDNAQGNVETVNDKFHNYLHPYTANDQDQQAKIWCEPINNGVKIYVQADLKGRSFRLPLYKYRTVQYSVKVNGQKVGYQADQQGYLQIVTKASLRKRDVLIVEVIIHRFI